MERKTGRVLSQSFRDDGISGRARSDRLLRRGPSFGEGGAIRVRLRDRKGSEMKREDIRLLANSLGGIISALGNG